MKGAGKTVLLNAIKEIADSQSVISEYIALEENENFVHQVTISCQKIQKKLNVFRADSVSFDMMELFLNLGKAAEKAERPICILIDDIQYLKKEEIGFMISALHRCQQLNFPIVFYATGLPQILQIFGEAKPYSERLFHFIKI